MSANGNTIHLGSTGSRGGQAGGTVEVSQAGTLIASGRNAVGIFAQSRGSGPGGTVNVDVNGTVFGGSGEQGYGVWIDGGTAANALRIGRDGRISALSEQAITVSPGDALSVGNVGTVIGSVSIGAGVFTNDGTYVTGNDVRAGSVVNNGTLRVGPAGTFATTTVSGGYTQRQTGVLVIDVDFAGGRASHLTVQGSAGLSGTVSPVATSILPGIGLPFLTVPTGPVQGSLTGSATSIFSYRVTQASRSNGGATFQITADADFHAGAPQQSASRTAVAGYLQTLWNDGPTDPDIGRLFAAIGNAAASGSAGYSDALGQLSPDAATAPGVRNSAEALVFATRSLSCPTFEGTTAMLTEGQCSWVRVSGQRTNGNPGGGMSGFRTDTAWWQIGGQYEFSPGWFLGGSLAYQRSWLSTNGGPVTGSGQTGYGSLVLKYQTGSWLFAAAGFGGAGQFNTARVIALPGLGSVAKGSPNVSSAGFLLRANYTIGEETFYLRPNLTLATVHSRTGAYQFPPA
jgi:hypothetical protein